MAAAAAAVRAPTHQAGRSRRPLCVAKASTPAAYVKISPPAISRSGKSPLATISIKGAMWIAIGPSAFCKASANCADAALGRVSKINGAMAVALSDMGCSVTCQDLI